MGTDVQDTDEGMLRLSHFPQQDLKRVCLPFPVVLEGLKIISVGGQWWHYYLNQRWRVLHRQE